MPRLIRDPFTPKPVRMAADFDQYRPRLAGPRCKSCRTYEARCAFKQGCCDACTHDFAEPQLPKIWSAA